MRLAMKPGTSFLHSTGFLPTERSTSMTVWAVSSEEASDLTTSTRGIRWPGFQKWVPTNRSRCLSSAEISLGLMTEELVQKMVSGRQRASSLAKVSRLIFMSSNTASITRSAFLTRSLSMSVVKEMRDRRSLSSASVMTPLSSSCLVLVRMPASTSVGYRSYMPTWKSGLDANT